MSSPKIESDTKVKFEDRVSLQYTCKIGHLAITANAKNLLSHLYVEAVSLWKSMSFSQLDLWVALYNAVLCDSLFG